MRRSLTLALPESSAEPRPSSNLGRHALSRGEACSIHGHTTCSLATANGGHPLHFTRVPLCNAQPRGQAVRPGDDSAAKLRARSLCKPHGEANQTAPSACLAHALCPSPCSVLEAPPLLFRVKPAASPIRAALHQRQGAMSALWATGARQAPRGPSRAKRDASEPRRGRPDRSARASVCQGTTARRAAPAADRASAVSHTIARTPHSALLLGYRLVQLCLTLLPCAHRLQLRGHITNGMAESTSTIAGRAGSVRTQRAAPTRVHSVRRATTGQPPIRPRPSARLAMRSRASAADRTPRSQRSM